MRNLKKKLGQIVGRIAQTVKKHKKKTLAIVLAAAVLIGVGSQFFRKKYVAQGMIGVNGTYTRTVVLSKGSLDETVSASGTVESDNVSDVTTSLTYSVKSIAVQVGDVVEEGDVICVLDSSELTTKIEKAEESLQESIDKAYASYADALEAKEEAQTAVSEAESALSSKNSALSTAKSKVDSAVSSIQSYQTAYDQAASAQEAAGKTLNNTPVVTAAPSIYAQQGKCRNHADFSTLKTIKQPL